MHSGSVNSTSNQNLQRINPANIVSTIFLFLIIVLNVFCADKGSFFHKRVFLLPNAVMLLIGMAVVSVYFVLCHMLRNTDFGKTARTIAKRPMTFRIVIIVVFVIQLVVCYGAYFETGWDVKMLLDNARIYAETGALPSTDYFSRYPNNLFLLRIYALIFKLAGNSAGIYMLLLINALSNTLSGLCLFRVLRRLFGYKRAWLGFFFWLALIGTSPWLIVPYSDSAALFIPILIFDLWLLSGDSSFGKKMFLYVAIALLSVVAYRIKPQAFIITIAFILLQLKMLFKPGKRSEKVLLFSVPVLVLIAFFFLTGLWSESRFSLDKNARFTVAHFFMMGANYTSNGTYNEADVEYSSSYLTVNERNRADLVMVKERYASMGTDLFTHLKNKLLVNFHDGTYAWEKEGTFYTTIYTGRLPLISNVTASALYGQGNLQRVFETIRQCCWLALLLMAALSGLTSRKKEVSVIFLTILGLVVFLLLFEARARYLYSNIPLFIVAALSFRIPKKDK